MICIRIRKEAPGGGGEVNEEREGERENKSKPQQTYQREHHSRPDQRTPDHRHGEVQPGLQRPAVQQQAGGDERACVDDGNEAVFWSVPLPSPLGPPHGDPIHYRRAEGDPRCEPDHQAYVDQPHRACGEGVLVFEDCWEGCEEYELFGGEVRVFVRCAFLCVYCWCGDVFL